MEAVELQKGIYWVGAVDWNLRNFHGYLTQRGSSYNAYLIIDEKVVLIDTVKHSFSREMLQRIRSVIDPEKIDIVISNHTEMDHSGSLSVILEQASRARLLASPNGKKGLLKHFGRQWDIDTVENGQTLNIGTRTLQFFLTPMVHWPDSMVTYAKEDRILFSNDAFGQHLASNARFEQEIDSNLVLSEAAKYYANIVLSYPNQVTKALEALAGLDITVIAPSHGLAWKKDKDRIIEAYRRWSSNQTTAKAVIVYDSMWNSTETLAGLIQEVFTGKGINALMMNLRYNHISDVMTELLEARYICVGSPTLNNQMLPTVSAFLTYMKGLAPRNRIGLAFGSYGWGGQSITQIEAVLKDASFTVLDNIKVQYIPNEDEKKTISAHLRKILE